MFAASCTLTAATNAAVLAADSISLLVASRLFTGICLAGVRAAAQLTRHSQMGKICAECSLMERRFPFTPTADALGASNGGVSETI